MKNSKKFLALSLTFLFIMSLAGQAFALNIDNTYYSPDQLYNLAKQGTYLQTDRYSVRPALPGEVETTTPNNITLDFVVITEKVPKPDTLSSTPNNAPSNQYRTIVTGSITENSWDGSYTVRATGTMNYSKYSGEASDDYYHCSSYSNYASSVSSEATVNSIRTNYWDMGGYLDFNYNPPANGQDFSGLDSSITRYTSLTSPYTYSVSHNRYYLNNEYSNLRQDITIYWTRGSGNYSTTLSVVLI